MKRKIFSLVMLFVLGAAMYNVMAQAPELIKYQAVLRDASGNVVANTAKTVVVDILQSSSSGTSVYQETHSVTTTAQGVINLNIGGGTPVSGTFSTIDWSSYTYWAKLMVDATEITNGQLLSVPYSLSVKGVDYDPATGNISVGGKIISTENDAACFQIGNNATLNDINQGNTVGLYGTYDATIGNLKLGSGGPTLSGKTNFLGIGTSSPQSILHLYGTESPSYLLVEGTSATLGPELRLLSSATNGSDWRIFSSQASNPSGAGNLEFYRSGTGTVATFLSGGNVGIGTVNPQNKLDVNGTGIFRGNVYINTGSNDAVLCVGPSSKRAIGYAQYWDQNTLWINGWGDWSNGTRVYRNLYVDGDIATLNGGDIVISGSLTASRLWNNSNEIVFQTGGVDMARISIIDGLRLFNQNSSIEGGQLFLDGAGGNHGYYIDNFNTSSPEDLRVVEEGGGLRAYMQMGTNGWQTPSDRRLKDNIQTLSVLSQIDKLRGTSYTLKDSGKPQIGVIAQELKEAFPVAVSGEESTGMLGVDYNAVAAIALQGVKELKEKVDQLEKENAGLKAQIGKYDLLKAEIETLKNLVGGESLGNK